MKKFFIIFALFIAVACVGLYAKSSSTTTRCSTCKGSGKCDYCHGTGRKTCAACDGDGETVTLRNQHSRCTHCSGKGSFKCVRCDGDGKCNRCNGKGVVKS